MKDRPDLDSNDPFKVLGIDEDASLKDIKRAYSQWIRRFRPETHPEEFQVLHAAYDELKSLHRGGSKRVQHTPRDDQFLSRSEPEMGSEQAPPHEAVDFSASPQHNWTRLKTQLLVSGKASDLVPLWALGDILQLPLDKQLEPVLQMLDAGQSIASPWLELLSTEELYAFLGRPEVSWENLAKQTDRRFSDELFLWKIHNLLKDGDSNAAAEGLQKWTAQSSLTLDQTDLPRTITLGLAALATKNPEVAEALFNTSIKGKFDGLMDKDIEDEKYLFHTFLKEGPAINRVEDQCSTPLSFFALLRALPTAPKRSVESLVTAVEGESQRHWDSMLETLNTLTKEAPETMATLQSRLVQRRQQLLWEFDLADDEPLDPQQAQFVSDTMIYIDSTAETPLINVVAGVGVFGVIVAAIVLPRPLYETLGLVAAVALMIAGLIALLALFLIVVRKLISHLYFGVLQKEFAEALVVGDDITVEHFIQWLEKNGNFSDNISLYDDKLYDDRALKLLSLLVSPPTPKGRAGGGVTTQS